MEPIRSGLRLKVLDGASHSEYLGLERSLISLGRSTPETLTSASYLTFPEPTVSRLHAVMTWESGAKAYLLHHRSQTNPTLLNNAAITGPQLLKSGDKITLGRLVLLVEPEPVASTLAPTPSQPAPEASPGLFVNAVSERSERVFSAPIKARVVSLNFVSERATAAVSPGQESDQWQEVRLPGSVASCLRFQLDPVASTCLVEAGATDQPPTHRISRSHHSELRVPLRPGNTLPFLDSDQLSHQGYKIWIGSPSRPDDAGSTLGQKPVAGEESANRELTLTFLNGPWKDAVIALPPRGATQIALGSGDIGFRHPFPFPRAPHCAIFVHDGVARLRASEVSDDQFLEVDGDLVFASESVALVSGSRLLVGEAEFLWIDSSVEIVYRSFRLVGDSGSYPVRKAVVRLGTAAHCEIMLPSRELPPVIGEISFQTGHPVYRHLDISASIRVDGEETSTGLSVKLHPGSRLELASGIELVLESTHQN